jgi:hypothetical protein
MSTSSKNEAFTEKLIDVATSSKGKKKDNH